MQHETILQPLFYSQSRQWATDHRQSSLPYGCIFVIWVPCCASACLVAAATRFCSVCVLHVRQGFDPPVPAQRPPGNPPTFTRGMAEHG